MYMFMPSMHSRVQYRGILKGKGVFVAKRVCTNNIYIEHAVCK